MIAPPASAITCTGTAWAADYFANQTLTGTPALSRCDATINNNWGQAAPATGIPADHFSVRWTRTVAFTAGTYLFSIRADDGMRVKMDGVVILDGFKDQGATNYSVSKDVTAGNHTLVIEYYDNTYDAVAVFSYAQTSTPPATTNLVSNGDLATGTGTPTCFTDGSWGTSTRSGAISTDMPAGVTGRSFVETVSAYTSGDVKIMPSDAAGCAPTVDPTKTYTLGVYYKSTVTTNAVPVFTGNGTGGWQYWTTLATLPASAGWSKQTLTVPPLPAGTTRLTFGVAAVGNGVLSTTGYSLTAGGTTPPVNPPPSGLGSTGQWTISNISLPARAMHSTLLNNGKLLLIAGSGNDSNNFAAGTFKTFVLDPNNGALIDVPTPVDMFCSEHVTLPNGKVLISGGTLGFPGVNSATFLGLKTSYTFDPATNQFTRLNDTSEGHWYDTQTKLGNGDVWMAGGLSDNNPNGGGVANTTEHFSFSQNRWLSVAEVNQTWQYWGEYPHMYLLQDGRLFYDGGHTFGNQRQGSGASIYDPNSGLVGDVPGLTNPDLRDHSGSVLLPPAQNQTFLIAGGGHIDAGSAPTNSTAIINMNVPNPAYVAGPPMPGPGRQYQNLTTMFDRRVLASNGGTTNRGGNIFAAAIYNPATNTWTTDTPADPVGRNYHSSTQLLPNGNVMAMASNDLDGTYELRISVYSPGYHFRGVAPTITAAPTDTTYGASWPLGVTGTVVSASLTSLGSQTHQMDSNARLVDLPITGTGTARTATVPTNPNLLPPGPYMLTVLDSDGVPSVARMVNVR